MRLHHVHASRAAGLFAVRDGIAGCPAVSFCSCFNDVRFSRCSCMQVHIPPLNHLGLWVDDIHSAVTWLSANGVRFAPGGIRKGAAGHDVTFIHPKGNDASPVSGCGVLVELVQAPADVNAAFDKIAGK